MKSGKTYAFNPDWASPPGDTIRDCMKTLKMTISELAEGLGVSFAGAVKLLHGGVLIRRPLARKLSKMLGGSELFWLNRELQYRQAEVAIAIKERDHATR